MYDGDYIERLLTFEKPLTSRFRKKYVETLALGILQYCYKEKYDGFEVHDSPDISDGNKLIGIEVTEAVSDEQAQIEGEFVKYRLESRTEEKERRKRIIEENGASVNQLGLTYPVKNGDDEKQIFQNAIYPNLSNPFMEKTYFPRIPIDYQRRNPMQGRRFVHSGNLTAAAVYPDNHGAGDP